MSLTKKPSKIYDYRESRRWRHLDIMQYKTYLNCRVPRVENEDGKITMHGQWQAMVHLLARVDLPITDLRVR